MFHLSVFLLLFFILGYLRLQTEKVLGEQKYV